MRCRSGRKSKVDGGRAGTAGWEGGAGVAIVVGATEALAEAGAWGVPAADMAVWSSGDCVIGIAVEPEAWC